MAKFIVGDDPEEDPFEALAKLKDQADSQIKPWQAALGKDDCFYYMSATTGIVVWGEIVEDQTDPELHGYRFCKCYSTACPEGELGDVHVAVIHRKVSRKVFEMARDAGWPHDEETFIKLSARVQAMREAN